MGMPSSKWVVLGLVVTVAAFGVGLGSCQVPDVVPSQAPPGAYQVRPPVVTPPQPHPVAKPADRQPTVDELCARLEDLRRQKASWNGRKPHW